MSIMNKTAKIFALAATAALLPVAAQAETTSFSRDGVDYTYTTSTKAGRTVVTGSADRDRSFRLVIDGDLVRGQFNGKPIKFSLSEVEPGVALALR